MQNADDDRRAYFVLTIGEHLDLARAEQESLVSLVSSGTKIEWKGQIGFFDSLIYPISFLSDRSVMAKESGEVFYSCSGPLRNLFESLEGDILRTIVDKRETFCVRTLSLAGVDTRTRLQTESHVGNLIVQATKAKVNLENPDVKVLVVFLSDSIIVCKSTVSRLRSQFRYKVRETLPFFHPSMMNTRLARVLCNLAGVMPQDTVFDPFCGAGGILSEALAIGANGIGMDLNWRLLRGAKTNLSERRSSQFSLIQGDARQLPLTGYDHIVTDPPYGRASSTRGSAANALVRDFLETSTRLGRKRGTLCICGSTEMGIPELIENLGLVPLRRLRLRVHKGLTREIVTLDI